MVLQGLLEAPGIRSCRKPDNEKPNRMELDPLVQFASHVAIHKILKHVSDVRAVVIQGEGGVEIASRQRQGVDDAPALAGLASWLAAVQAAARGDARIGECGHALIWSNQGLLVMVPAHHRKMPLAVGILVGSGAILSQALHFGREAARMLEAATDPDEFPEAASSPVPA